MDQDAARAQRVAEGGVLGRPRSRKAAHLLHHVEAYELVVAEADLRAPEAELEGRAKRAAKVPKSCTRFTSLMRRAIDTRMKIDDCWIAQILPRMSSRS